MEKDNKPTSIIESLCSFSPLYKSFLRGKINDMKSKVNKLNDNKNEINMISNK